MKKILFFTIFPMLITLLTCSALYAKNGNEDMREEVLAAHNKYRAELNIPSLLWSNKLATHAKEWALHLARSGGKIYHSKESGEGENLWQGTAGRFSYTARVDAWGKEKRYFKNGNFPDVSTSGNWSDVGHYTQVIWRDTTHVGCATARVANYDIFVCRYSPPGNYIGQKVY